jgi:hypothetical protein
VSRIEVFDSTGTELSDDIVHVTYRGSRDGHEAWRSSIWTSQGGRWRMLFDQATPIPPTDTA